MYICILCMSMCVHVFWHSLSPVYCCYNYFFLFNPFLYDSNILFCTLYVLFAGFDLKPSILRLSGPCKFPTSETIRYVFEYTCTGVCMCMGMCVQTTYHSHNHQFIPFNCKCVHRLHRQYECMPVRSTL